MTERTDRKITVITVTDDDDDDDQFIYQNAHVEAYTFFGQLLHLENILYMWVEWSSGRVSDS